MSRLPRGYWTYERVCAEAKLYQCVKLFRLKAQGAFMAAKRNGWFSEATSHMSSNSTGNLKWTPEAILTLVKTTNFNSYSEFKRKFPSAYTRSLDYGMRDEIRSHISPPSLEAKTTKDNQRLSKYEQLWDAGY